MNLHRPTFFAKNRMLSLALMIALLLLSAGCSSDSEEPTDPPPTVAPAPATNTLVPETENIQPVEEEPTPQPQAIGPMDLLDTASNRGDFSRLVAAIQAAGLEEKLRSAGPFTILAPTDAAFNALPSEILGDSELLFDILLYHVIEGELSAGDIANQTFITSMLGDDLAVTIDGATIRLDGAVVTDQDISATNGVIHVIDMVLIPPSSGLIQTPMGAPVARASLPNLLDVMQSADRLDILLDGLDAAGLTTVLMGSGPFTIFAPTDDAFLQFVESGSAEVIRQLDSEPAPFLLHYVIADDLHSFFLVDGSAWPTLTDSQLLISATGAGLMVVGADGSQAMLTSTDLQAKNGIVHIIDSVVFPSSVNTLAATTE